MLSSSFNFIECTVLPQCWTILFFSGVAVCFYSLISFCVFGFLSNNYMKEKDESELKINYCKL